MNVARPYRIVGPGRMGLAVAAALAEAGALTELVIVGRRQRPPDHPVFRELNVKYQTGTSDQPPDGVCLILAVPDGEIETVAGDLSRLGRAPTDGVALHLSGALSSAVLAGLADAGYATGSLHPLQTVAEAARGAERLRGSYFTFEGDPAARGAAGAIVAAVGGQMLELHPADRARYHAACVFASNYFVVCGAVAARTLAEATGVTREEAVDALRPLWRGTIANLDESGLPDALTGPVARGDVATLRAHLAALSGDRRDLYARLALVALELACEAGLEADVAGSLESELRGRISRESG